MLFIIHLTLSNRNIASQNVFLYVNRNIANQNVFLYVF